MNIMVTGATGLVGKSLIPALLSDQHSVMVVGRDTSKIRSIFGNTVDAVSWDQLNTLSPDLFNIVINLAGENIADRKWNETTKVRIQDSRTQATSQIVQWCLGGENKNIRLYNASAIGIYGLQTAMNGLPRAMTEAEQQSPQGVITQCFLQEVAKAWENATIPAAKAGLPVTLMRFGVVLKKGYGILGKLALPFSLGLGSVLGTGRQAFSWVHIDDLIQAIQFLIAHPDITGPVNMVSPRAVSQKEFAQALATSMRRPLFLKMPGWFIKIIFGEMGEELLLGGQNIYPERLLKAGYNFRFSSIHEALTQEKNPENPNKRETIE